MPVCQLTKSTASNHTLCGLLLLVIGSVSSSVIAAPRPTPGTDGAAPAAATDGNARRTPGTGDGTTTGGNARPTPGPDGAAPAAAGDADPGVSDEWLRTGCRVEIESRLAYLEGFYQLKPRFVKTEAGEFVMPTLEDLTPQINSRLELLKAAAAAAVAAAPEPAAPMGEEAADEEDPKQIAARLKALIDSEKVTNKADLRKLKAALSVLEGR